MKRTYSPTTSHGNSNNKHYHDDRPRKEHVRYPFPTPEVRSIDTISLMSDELLSETYTEVNKERIELLKTRFPTVLWDTELAYLQREGKIRADRRAAHRAYQDEILREIEEQKRIELTLPDFVPNYTFEDIN